ncbi:MAG TPA: phosphotransferase, partial [Actinopolymorphaceae bacterium]
MPVTPPDPSSIDAPRIDAARIDAARIDAVRIDEQLVADLVAEQFPAWAALPLRVVARGGNDHRMFRLGDDLLVRLPSGSGYVPQVAKEQAWLPRLAPCARLPIPQVRGVGHPTSRFPAPWSVYQWLDGEPASTAAIDDPVRFAADLAGFLVGLRDADTADAPPPGPHSAFRGGPLEHWNDEMQVLFARVDGRERSFAKALWRDALSAPFVGEPVWFH